MKAHHRGSKATRDLWKRRHKSLGTFHWLRFLNIKMRWCFALVGTLEDDE